MIRWVFLNMLRTLKMGKILDVEGRKFIVKLLLSVYIFLSSMSNHSRIYKTYLLFCLDRVADYYSAIFSTSYYSSVVSSYLSYRFTV